MCGSLSATAATLLVTDVAALCDITKMMVSKTMCSIAVLLNGPAKETSLDPASECCLVWDQFFSSPLIFPFLFFFSPAFNMQVNVLPGRICSAAWIPVNFLATDKHVWVQL